MAKIQRITGWIIVLIGVIHLGVTFVDYDTPSLRALWFFGSGFSLLLIGGLNVIVSSLADPLFQTMTGLRRLTLFANACGITLGALFTGLTGGTQPQGPILVAVFVLGAVSQYRRRPAS